jgi:hypothetical protein
MQLRLKVCIKMKKNGMYCARKAAALKKAMRF